MLIENIGSVAGDVGSAAGHDFSEMMLRDNLEGEPVFKDFDIRVLLHLLHEALLYFGSGVVGMVEDSEL